MHARSGEGAKVAAQLLAEAALEMGRHIQAFPEFTAERTGAPMRTFVRISENEIRVYEPIEHPDAVLILDPSLIGVVEVTEGLKKKSIIIVNSKHGPEYFRKKTGFSGKIYTLDASDIAVSLVGKNYPNMPLLGALIKLTGIVDLGHLEKKIRDMYMGKIGKERTLGNIEAVKRGYESISKTKGRLV